MAGEVEEPVPAQSNVNLDKLRVLVRSYIDRVHTYHDLFEEYENGWLQWNDQYFL